MLRAPLGRLVAFCSRRALLVVVLATVLAAGALLVTRARLGVSTDTGNLFSASLPWKQRANVLKRDFPQNEDLLVAVIRADIPEEGQETARQLAAVLAAQTARFKSVRRPDADPYLARNALLFLAPKPLEALLNATIDAQPFLGQLAADPSSRGLFEALGLIGDGIAHGQANLANFQAPLRAFARNLGEAAAGHPTPLSWQRLLTSSLSDLGGQYQFVETQPRLNFGSFAPGGVATDAMRAAIAALPEVRAGHAQVYITGQVALDDEEFASVAEGAVKELIASLVLVTLWLFLAVRSWRIIIPIVIVLLLGLLLTTGFAAIAVGTLNLVSVAFAVLFVGIAVDFAIQFSVRFRAQRHGTGQPLPLLLSLSETGRETGVQILIAASATAAGFLAFTPTAFRGVAQLGLIAGVGMLIAFACTLTVLPALLMLFGYLPTGVDEGFAWARRYDRLFRRNRRRLIAGFAVLGLAGAALLPLLRFDGDPLHTKNPNWPGMRALHLLMNNPQTSPYSAEMLVPDLAAARALAVRLEKLPLVSDVRTLDSFVPTDQDQKLPLIQDAASLLLPTLLPYQVAPAPDAAAIRAAMLKTVASLAPVLGKLTADDPLRAITAALQILSKRPDADLLAANRALVQYLPVTLDQLRTVLQAKPTGLGDVPPGIARDWILPDGQAHMEVHVRNGASDSATLNRFLREVRGVYPNVSGSVVTIIASASTIVSAFKIAALSALAMIALILLIALRRLRDVALVLAPLLLSAMLTVILCLVLRQPLNFANIIALPLLLGVGVSFNIYFMMNWRAGMRDPLGSPTAKAVLFSALTTGTAFGSLALSHHPGTASMGRLLLMSLACTLLATLVFEPALLPRRRQDPH
ncbi:MMPL family transporter [Lichenicoccus sp.]|uniref:MMPL family transporter n=1 Tax=Lichenicoccus sp. TaxID=2781899 RepID=UPI003D0AAD9E